MSAAVPIPVIQLLQVLTVAVAAPGLTGVIARVEARLQGRAGPRVLQPYYDLAKLFRKEALAPEGASWFFLAAPVIAVAAYLTVPLLIPVLTTYGLPLGYMGDILGGGFLLSLASFLVATAALESGGPYAQLGASRAKTFSAITEPVVLFVVFTVALLTGTDLPYALAATVRSSAGQIVRPAHLLASAALFMVILSETGRIPVETHTGTNEFGMIDEARPSMLVAPMMNSLALLWIAVEVTTVISALLVALENSDAAVEAAWKYVLIASAGLGLGLLATIFAYFAGAQVLGQHYDLALNTILAVGSRLAHTPVRFAFMLAVLGYRTKVGLFPVHTWLPDAHSEAPTPVSALLSGSLLAVSFYAILRYYQIATATLGTGFPRDVLLAFGVASLLLAALYLLDQRDIKRLLAYSSVEHMGILAIGVSFGAPIALAGVMLHVLAHAAAKGNAFMGAGVLLIKFGSKQMAAQRGALDLLPWSGPLFLLAVLALSAMPPFGIFRSEFQIVAGGFSSHGYAPAAILVILVTVAFFGLTAATTGILFRPRRPAAAPVIAAAVSAVPGDSPSPAEGRRTDGGGFPAAPGPARVTILERAASVPAITRSEPSVCMVVPAVAGIAALLVLGLHPPGELTQLISRAVTQLGGTT